MSVNSRQEGDVLIAYITEKSIVDESQIHEIGSQLTALIDQCEDGHLLLNFRAVAFMSSDVLGKIVQINKRCRESDIDFRLCEISSDLMRVIEITKLNKVFNIQKSEEQALASFAREN